MAVTAKLPQRLIKKHGRAGVKLVRPGQGQVSDASKPWKPDTPQGDATLVESFSAVFLDAEVVRQSQRSFSGALLVDSSDSLLAECTQVVYIAPPELGEEDVRVADLLESKGRRFSVLKVSPIEPGEERLLIIAQVRG